VQPHSCPPATFTNATGNTKFSDCKDCFAGFSCPFNGTTYPTISCSSGFICPLGTSRPFLRCEPSYYCPEQSAEMIPCSAGTYQNEFEQSSCKACTAGSYCKIKAVNRTKCEPSFYCPAGSAEMVSERSGGGGMTEIVKCDRKCDRGVRGDD